ncbi:MAG: hypothetical protein ABI878_11265 [Acidobacteriota bacterium]
MRRFNYWTRTKDEKMSGSVDASYLVSKLMHRQIEGTGSGGDNKEFDLYFTDGSAVKFILNDNDADMVYYAPDK